MRQHRLTIGALLLGLAATGCAEDTPTTAPPDDGTDATDTRTSPEPLDPSATDIGTIDDAPSVATHAPTALGATCRLQTPDGGSVTVPHPEGWAVGDDCTVFDPTLEAVPDDATPAAITLEATRTPYAELAAPGPGRVDAFRAIGAVDGRQALRIEATTTGASDRPEGTPVVRWVVDLDPATNDGGGTLVATATGGPEVDLPVVVAVLDEMVRGLELGDTPEGVVASVEGGGAPYAVRLDDGCLVLASTPSGEALDRACDVVRPDDVVATVTTLRGSGATVAVGQVPTNVHMVRDDGIDGVGAVTWPVDDDPGAPRLFALRAAEDATLRLLSFDGTDRGTITVGGR